MPLFQYFGWVGSFLARGASCRELVLPRTDRIHSSDVPLDQKVHIRIHTDHKWPERVVLDTTRTTLAHDAKADGETDVAGSETAIPAERQPFEAFAEMAPAARPCFRPPCYSRRVQNGSLAGWERRAAPNRSRLPMTTRKGFTLPSRLHKLPGRS